MKNLKHLKRFKKKKPKESQKVIQNRFFIFSKQTYSILTAGGGLAELLRTDLYPCCGETTIMSDDVTKQKYEG